MANENCVSCPQGGEDALATVRCVECGAGICEFHIYECRKCEKPMCEFCWKRLGKDFCKACSQ